MEAYNRTKQQEWQRGANVRNIQEAKSITSDDAWDKGDKGVKQVSQVSSLSDPWDFAPTFEMENRCGGGNKWGGKMIDVTWPELQSRGLGARGTASTQRWRCRAEPREVKSWYNNKDVRDIRMQAINKTMRVVGVTLREPRGKHTYLSLQMEDPQSEHYLGQKKSSESSIIRRCQYYKTKEN